jgi:hypothetical protein
LSEIAKVWFSEAKKLLVDEAIFLRVANKTEQMGLVRALEKEREFYSKLDAVHASQFFFNPVLKNLKQYVVIERKYRSPFTAFYKTSSGNFSKVTIDPDRRRQLKLMVKDKKTREEIEELLNGLTESEIEEFFKEEK